MALLSISHEDPASVTAQELPLWTNDVVVDAVAVTQVPDESEVSDTEEEVRARVARLDIDEDILNALDADMDNAMRRWRNLYHQRVRCGTNKALWSFTRTVASVAESVFNKTENAKLKGTDARRVTCLLVTEHGLCSFLELIVSQDDFFSEYPDFVMSVLDVVIAVVAEAEKNVVVLRQSRELIAALCDNAWKTHTLLADNDGVDRFYPLGREGVRHQLYFVMLAIIMPLTTKSLGSESVLRKASFVCWFYSPEMEETDGSELNFSTIMLDYAITGNHGTSKSRKNLDEETVFSAQMEMMKLDILPAFGAKAYLARLCKTLENPKLIDESLNWAITSMSKSVIAHSEFLNELSPSGALKAGVECVNRQALKGKPGKQSDSLCHFLGMYTTIMKTGPTRHHPAYTPLIREGCIVEIVSRALRVCVTEGQSYGLTYAMCLNALNALKICVLPMNKLSAKNILRKTMRHGFRDDWYPTLTFLRQTRPRASVGEHDRLLDTWKRLGEDMGFDEDVQKADYERELRKALRHCTRTECRYHKDVCPVRVRACKGCAEARYCSSACQRIDWKDGHKSRCKRLNGAEGPPDAI
ncbi:hypothetical protein PENSPDRAFT_751527 [Peniophora sp. CONT]|nr:hypothetical protein PENSPDRAFT_751527 [Peniophora sp. CONT]